MNLIESLLLLAASVALLICWSRAQWRKCFFPSEIALGRGAAILRGDIVFVCWRLCGCSHKSRLATLRTETVVQQPLCFAFQRDKFSNALRTKAFVDTCRNELAASAQPCGIG
jgi:hypothetical protein